MNPEHHNCVGTSASWHVREQQLLYVYTCKLIPGASVGQLLCCILLVKDFGLGQLMSCEV